MLGKITIRRLDEINKLMRLKDKIEQQLNQLMNPNNGVVDGLNKNGLVPKRKYKKRKKHYDGKYVMTQEHKDKLRKARYKYFATR